MPFFKVSPHRYINTEHVADIWYHAAGEMHIRVNAAATGETLNDIRSPHQSVLTIELRNKDLLPLRFEGDEADAVWADFENAMKPLASTD